MFNLGSKYWDPACLIDTDADDEPPFSLTSNPNTSLATPMIPGARLSLADCPTSQDEKDEMATRPYRELVGCLSWLALGTRPDLFILQVASPNPIHTKWRHQRGDVFKLVLNPPDQDEITKACVFLPPLSSYVALD